MTDIPEWAYERVKSLTQSENLSLTRWDRQITAFAKYIAAHEEMYIVMSYYGGGYG